MPSRPSPTRALDKAAHHLLVARAAGPRESERAIDDEARREQATPPPGFASRLDRRVDERGWELPRAHAQRAWSERRWSSTRSTPTVTLSSPRPVCSATVAPWCPLRPSRSSASASWTCNARAPCPSSARGARAPTPRRSSPGPARAWTRVSRRPATPPPWSPCRQDPPARSDRGGCVTEHVGVRPSRSGRGLGRGAPQPDLGNVLTLI